MRAVIQRVSEASVHVDGELIGSCREGLLVLLGVGPDDTPAMADAMLGKILRLRIFKDENGKMNRSVQDIGGEMLLISQFTLYADCTHGNRPAFTGAGQPDAAERLYEYMLAKAQEALSHVGHGVFGADMKVSLCNDGPVTICLDSSELFRNGVKP